MIGRAHARRPDPGSILKLGDVVFERRGGTTSKAIAIAQKSLNLNGEHTLSHAAIVVAPRLLFEATLKTNVAFRVLENEESSSDIQLIYRPKSIDSKKLLEAVHFLYGENYSRKLIFTHVFSERQRTNFDQTIGSTFCSALIKRVLHLAGANENLAKDLLLAPCELQYDLAGSSNWSNIPQEDWCLRFKDSRRKKRVEDRVLKMARILKSSLETLAKLEDHSASLTQRAAIHKREILDIEELASNIGLLSQANKQSTQPSRWGPMVDASVWSKIADKLRVRIAEYVPCLLPTQLFDRSAEELRAIVEELEKQGESSRRDEIARALASLLNSLDVADLYAAKESISEAISVIGLCGLPDQIVEKVRQMLDGRLTAVVFLLSLKKRYS